MFHINLKKRRLINGLSQKQLAEYLNISPQSISKWEKAEALPSIDYLPKIAEFLNCDINALFAPVENNSFSFAILYECISLIRNEDKTKEEITEFENNNPSSITATIEFFENLSKQKILHPKTIQKTLNCTDNETRLFIKQLIAKKVIEKLDMSDTYYVSDKELESLLTFLYLKESKIENKNNSSACLKSFLNKLKNLES